MDQQVQESGVVEQAARRPPGAGAVPRDVSVIVKCTRKCNFACDYCVDRVAGDSKLGIEDLAGIVSSVLRRPEAGRTTFVWHGGEPLTLGRRYFEKVLAVQALAAAEGQHVRNILQTNGSLLDAEWARFLRDNEIGVGVSEDGPPAVHDRNRPLGNGHGTSAAVARGIRSLQDDGAGFGVLCVATPQLMAGDRRELLDFFVAQGVRRVAFLPLRPARAAFADLQERDDHYRLRDEYADFMCELFDIWIARDDPSFDVRELSNILATLVGGESTTCIGSGPCVGRHFGLDATGCVSHCDKFFGDERFVFGSFRETGFDEMLDSPRLDAARRLESDLRQACAACPWAAHCQGGCLFDAALFAASGLQERPRHCHLRRIYDHIAACLQQAVPFASSSQPKEA
jgi:uncharacterized protein